MHVSTLGRRLPSLQKSFGRICFSVVVFFLCLGRPCGPALLLCFFVVWGGVVGQLCCCVFSLFGAAMWASSVVVVGGGGGGGGGVGVGVCVDVDVVVVVVVVVVGCW